MDPSVPLGPPAHTPTSRPLPPRRLSPRIACTFFTFPSPSCSLSPTFCGVVVAVGVFDPPVLLPLSLAAAVISSAPLPPSHHRREQLVHVQAASATYVHAPLDFSHSRLRGTRAGSSADLSSRAIARFQLLERHVAADRWLADRARPRTKAVQPSLRARTSLSRRAAPATARTCARATATCSSRAQLRRDALADSEQARRKRAQHERAGLERVSELRVLLRRAHDAERRGRAAAGSWRYDDE